MPYCVVRARYDEKRVVYVYLVAFERQEAKEYGLSLFIMEQGSCRGSEEEEKGDEPGLYRRRQRRKVRKRERERERECENTVSNVLFCIALLCLFFFFTEPGIMRVFRTAVLLLISVQFFLCALLWYQLNADGEGVQPLTEDDIFYLENKDALLQRISTINELRMLWRDNADRDCSQRVLLSTTSAATIEQVMTPRPRPVLARDAN